MNHQNILFSNNVGEEISKVLSQLSYNKAVIIMDVNTYQFVFPILAENEDILKAEKIIIKAGDINKNLSSLSDVWKQLDNCGATRKSVIINLGGGVVTDLGGFAASTFKRGVRFINVPTTLLSAVDAAVGGKTGINFNGLKNEIGAFSEADIVILSTVFFKTLPLEEIKSGYAEMLKHGLLSTENQYKKLISYDFSAEDYHTLLDLLKDSVEVKEHIVKEDPLEKGIRRALNLGHTAGHAFESLALERMSPIPHGYAVAWGLVVELILSHTQLKFDSKILSQLANYVYANYGAFNISCEDYPKLLALMRHDKKSENGEINFSLLRSIGDIAINQIVDEKEVEAAFDIYRDYMHI